VGFDRLASTNLKGHSFWRRQFAPTQTTPQLFFDVIVGGVAPVLCFYFDPIVFQGSSIGGPPLYSNYQVFAYAITAIEVAVLWLWLFVPRLRSVGAFFSGILITGSLFSVVIGCAILPFTLLGLLVAIGVFGFTPFLTAFVYLRNGVRALRSDANYTIKRGWLSSAMMGFVLALGLPVFASVEISRMLSNTINIILNGNSTQVEVAINQLKWLPFVPQEKLDAMVNSYEAESDENKKDRWRKCYRAITGVDIEARARMLND
jgi:hypothetical protein